jgi:hypothetical protein
MIKIEIDIDTDVDTLDIAIQTLEDCKTRVHARNELEEIKRKNRKKKKTIDELIEIVDEELIDHHNDLEDANVFIANLDIKRQILEDKKIQILEDKKNLNQKKIRTIKKKVPLPVIPEEETKLKGTVRFLIDETEKRVQMDKEMFENK